MNPITQRDAFWSQVYNLAKFDRNVVIVSADMGAPALDIIRVELTSQFVNVGIAEQNAINLAAGLVLAGKKVFTYAIAPFITLRCLEQIRVQNAIMNIPITIVGVGAGVSYSDSGPTHHILEDIAILRAMPNIHIHNVTDSIMAGAFARIVYKSNTTNYVRLDREILPAIYSIHQDFSEGLSVLKPAKDYYLIATGSMVHSALHIANKLEKQGIQMGVIDAYTFPINPTTLLDIVRQAKKIITLEEHFLAGGLGSAICEILQDQNCLIPVKRFGIAMEKGYCYQYGGRDVIQKYYNLDPVHIANEIKLFLKSTVLEKIVVS